MLLSEQIKCRKWGTCDVGKRASDSPDPAQYRNAVVWPLEFLPRKDGVYVGDTGYTWRVYLNMGNGSGKHMTFVLCHDHDVLLTKSAENTARDEVELARACYDWWERTGS